jgi:uncharacterized protein (TIGR00369 family)
MEPTAPPHFAVRDPAYDERVVDSLANQPFMHSILGARATRIEPGCVEVELEVRPELCQPYGNLHGAVLAALADSAAGYAAQTLMPSGADVVTVEYKINFLAPAHGGCCVARGRVVRAGRTLYVCAADVFARRPDGDTLVAHSVTTMMQVTR